MSKIIDKRNSLERFIREQTLGPGINGYRYVDLESEALTDKVLIKEEPLNYSSEILDIVPAAIYSTGILFPEDKSSTCKEGIALDNNEQADKKDEAEEQDSQNNSSEDIEATEEVELNQMFPRTMGLTCCLDGNFLSKKTIEFKINFRYYQKLKQDKEGKFNNKYGLLCEVNHEEIQKFITKYDLNFFRIKTINENHFLLLSKLSNQEITQIKTKIREIQKQIAETLFDLSNSVSTIPQLTKASCYLSNLKSSIYYELKNSITNDETRAKLYEVTQKIELVESITDHFRNLLDVYSGGYGLWQSTPVERIIKLDNINFPTKLRKISYLYNKSIDEVNISVIKEDGTISDGLKDIFRFNLDDKKEDYASISANIQLSRDSRRKSEQVFLKIQLINTSIAFDEAKQNDNRYYSTFNELVNQKSFFGVNLSIECEDLIPYSNHEYPQESDNTYSEDTTTSFIYDQFKDFAIGHNCSVKWSKLSKPRMVETEYLPFCETPDIDPIPRDKSKRINDEQEGFISPLFLENSKSQEFKWLSTFSDASNDDILNGLNEFVDSYGNWIELKRKDEKYQGDFSGIANQELEKCVEDYKRMKENINNFLSGNKNEEKLNSFRLMNAAMFMQLWHSVKAKDGKVISLMIKDDFTNFNPEFYINADDKLFSPYTEPAGWRAFQLAFILLNLDGIFKSEDDTNWNKRNNWVDLVWFPTGGGKTEAYLGLIALTIINRRKEFKEKGGGTAAIMRYTLRLLTMQQFQRASLVIMALELIRRWGTYELGDEPINIGLWVGNNSLPNKLLHDSNDRNKDSLLAEFEKINKEEKNKIPLDKCPWCGSKLKAETTTHSDTTATVFEKNRLHLYCSNTKLCSFGFGKGRPSSRKLYQGPIPVCLSDETIYQHPPALLFGTVDKFAQLAHKIDGSKQGINKDSRRIFGNKNCSWEQGKPKDGYLPPDLIIQDELHLLLGPLGSAVALFESAVDQLCTRDDGTRPKIISSTATTRNTQFQIAALFDRKVNLFPKPGVECDDSFFAFYKRRFKSIDDKSPEYLSKRKYIGILPTGRTQIWMQMRLAAIIMTHRAIFELEELGEKDPIDFDLYKNFEKAMDYYHTTISYFNSLKEVGKTQSQVQTYILKELRRVFARVVRPQKLMHSLYTYGPIQESELTGRLSGEEVKNELKSVETKWNAKKRFASNENNELSRGKVPPEFVVATNMISVGIDVSRFNTIIMNSMPRNTAEYIQASSRVARNDYGLVLTVHHPFRARDISHYEKFIEFHEKMYSYVEPISITPFTQKAVERYMGLYLATMIRHTTRFTERRSASDISSISENELSNIVSDLMTYFERRKIRMSTYNNLISNLLRQENIVHIKSWIEEAFSEWKEESNKNLTNKKIFVFNNKSAKSTPSQEQLYVDIDEYEGNIHSKKWQVPMSLRVIEPEAAIKINSL
ncbi:helicase-related protein [Chryseobacterium luquanense]|uniref:Helicase-related protein n=1 Tax=Chryseobacterium luquanense TaxID=2983766 RepID=A0ABT3Y3H0_9FLAO|nr:helicase-related protein [Chryseobacterium luquanense]MCX8532675.1 helicase-related protein [Chryseobacterium luquanense]